MNGLFLFQNCYSTKKVYRHYLLQNNWIRSNQNESLKLIFNLQIKLYIMTLKEYFLNLYF